VAVDRVHELAMLIVKDAEGQLDRLPQPVPAPCSNCPGGVKPSGHLALDHATVTVSAGLLWRLREALR
jgi:hypothetical protein